MRYHIVGGAGAEEAAAIAAVVAAVEAEAALAAARRPSRPEPSPWVRTGRPPRFHAAVPSSLYDERPWSLDAARRGR